MRKASLCLIALATLCSSGCDEQADNRSNIQTTVKSLGYGKPVAPVMLKYSIPVDIQPSTQFEVSLKFTSSTPTGSLVISLNAEEALTILGTTQKTFDLRLADKVFNTILLAQSEQKTFLNIIASEFDEQGNPMLGRSFSIPINIGDSSSKQPKRSSKKLPGGQRILEDGEETIIEMPAEQR